MSYITVEAVDTITDFETLLAFFRDTLEWPIPEDVTLGEIAFPWSSSELDLDETSDARLVARDQLPPFAREALGFSPEVGSQPWGIFFVEFSSDRVYRTELRRVLRGLVERRTRDAHLPVWELDHLLFICTTAGFQRFAFAHFSGAGASWQDAVLSIFSWERGDTHLRTLCEYNLPALAFPRGGFSSPQAWVAKWQQAFDVEAVTDQFFREYKSVFELVEAALSGIAKDDSEARRLYTQRLLNRLMFLRFLERKGWLRYAGRRDYFRALYEASVGIGSPSGSAASLRSGGVISDKDKETRTESLLNDRLYYVFFHGLSNPAGQSDAEDATARDRRGDVPFLNGGLFEMQPYDERHAVHLPNDTFADILNLFERYNFTITESTPLDIEVAVDPEMLGKVFEELVTGRHASGSYYTPRAVVSFMCRESLKLCLQTQTTETAACLTQFIDGGDATGIRDSEGVLEVLRSVRVCDPACGSGAYLLGMMGELLRLRDALFQSDQTDSGTVYERKLEIIRKNLYGVDRDDFAVNIAMLRLWLSLTVDYEGAVPQPLPNLDYKVATGDSLTGAAPEQLTLDRPLIQEIQEKQADYFITHGDAKKEALRAEIAALRADLQGWQDAPEEAFVWQVEFPEVFQAGGFDVVIGNPPYVRQELIKAMKPTYKRLFPEVYVGTADLYVYFYKRGTELLRRHGILAYISSNKFLRAAYGRKLRAFFSDAQRIQRLLDFGSVSVFKASVDTCILILENATSDGAPVSVATFRDASDVLRLSAAFRERAFRLHPRDLSAEGWTLASPETLQLLRKLETTGTPLGGYVDGLWRGVVTGYNKAFIIDAAIRQRLISEDPKSNELIKPLLRGRDLRKWRTDSTGQYLIFTRHGVEIDRYPAIKKHLSQYRRNLEPKKSRAEKYGRKMGSYKWYEIQDVVAYYAEFEKPKILYPEISKELYAGYDTSGAFGLKTTYSIPTNDLSLLAILNSRLFDWYARHSFGSLGDTWEGGGLFFFRQYMEQVPIADRTDAQKVEMSRLVEQILADPESEGVQEIEREIDRWVYRVYGLTDAEVALIQRTYREAGMAV